MPLAGTTATFPLLLQDAAGTALVYADKAAFTGAGWDIVFHGHDGVALAVQPVWDLLVGSVATQPDVYQIQYVVPSGEFTAVVTVPGTNYAVPVAYLDRGTANDSDTIAGLIVSASGSFSGADVFNDSVTLFQGESIAINAVVSEQTLAFIGAASLADCDSITAEIKLSSTAAIADAEVEDLVVTVVTDTAASRTLRATRNAFPAALDVTGADSASVSARCDVRLTKGLLSRIGSTVDVRIVWSANP